MAKMLWPASAASQCASLTTRQSKRLRYLSPRYLSIAMERKQASLDAFFGKKRRRVDSEVDIAPTPTADHAEESNVEDRQRRQSASELTAVTDNNLGNVTAIVDIGMVAGQKAMEVCLNSCLQKTRLVLHCCIRKSIVHCCMLHIRMKRMLR